VTALHNSAEMLAITEEKAREASLKVQKFPWFE
jgi:hypothetical protein